MKNNKNFNKSYLRKKKSFKWKKLFLLFGFIIFVSVSIWVLFFSDLTQIKNKEIYSSCDGLKKSSLESLVGNYLKGKYLFVLPKNNIVIFSKKGLTQHLVREEKLIKNIKIEKKFPGKLIMNFDCRDKYFVWCESSRCFLIDDEGNIFHDLTESNSGRYKEEVLNVNSLGFNNLQVGDSLFDQKKATFLANLIKEAELKSDFSFKKQATMPALVANEIELETDKGWKVLLNLDEGLDKQLRIIDKILSNQLKDKNLENLDYIDLRIPGKAVYKMKNIEIKEGEKKKDQ